MEAPLRWEALGKSNGKQTKHTVDKRDIPSTGEVVWVAGLVGKVLRLDTKQALVLNLTRR